MSSPHSPQINSYLRRQLFLRTWRTVVSYLDCFLVPKCFHRWQFRHLMNGLTPQQMDALKRRVDYYNKLEQPTDINETTSVGAYNFPVFKRKRFSTYFLDLYEILRYFPARKSFLYLFGDITYVPEEPVFTKSRPIAGDNRNSVIMKLDKRRHFRFVRDDLSFSEKNVIMNKKPPERMQNNMKYAVGALLGLLWGAILAWINSRINKKAIAKNSTKAVLTANAVRMLIDIAGLATVFLLRNILHITY